MQASTTQMEEVGARRDLASGLTNIGFLEIMVGRFGEAEATLRRGLALANELGAVRITTVATQNLALALFYRGKPGEGLRTAVLAEQRARDQDSLRIAGAAMVYQARCLLALDRAAEARAVATRALEVLAAMPPTLAYAYGAVAAVKAKKPVVVSMSDVAASGGYYIAAGATRIYAEPDTLTGSIGVVGGKLALGPALAKLGVTTYPMGRGRRATMFASLDPWSADEKVAVQAMMQATYQVFVGRVAAGRGKTPAEIEPIAQGRVWTGVQAKQLGLVDELGGLEAALAAARELGKVDAGAEVEVYPPELTLHDLVGRIGEVSVGALGGAATAAAGAVGTAAAGVGSGRGATGLAATFGAALACAW